MMGRVGTGLNAIRISEESKIFQMNGETAVNVQANGFRPGWEFFALGCVHQKPGNGENNHFYGEYLVNAQGEDVAAGIRTPAPINETSKTTKFKRFVTFRKIDAKQYKELDDIQQRLEKHYKTYTEILSSPSKKVNYICYNVE